MGYFILLLLLVGLAGGITLLAMLGLFDSVTPGQVVRDPVAPGGLRQMESVRQRRALPAVAGAWGIAGALIMLTTLFSAYAQIDSGHVGVLRTFGEITGQIDEGANWIAPWQSVQVEDVRTRKAEFRNPTAEDNDDTKKALLGQLSAGSQETQNVYMDVAVNYNIDASRVQELFRNIGPQWFTILVPERVRDITKAVVVQYGAVAITQKREEIRNRVTDELQREFEPYGIHIESVQLANISYDEAFEREIEAKQVATQAALRGEEQVRVKEAEARQAVAVASGAANASIESARGRAQSLNIESQAQADANARISNSLTPILVQEHALAKLQGVSIALVPADGTTLLDPTSILRKP